MKARGQLRMPLCSCFLPLAMVLGCPQPEPPEPDGPAPTDVRPTWPLARMADLARIESLPASGRPDDAPPPRALPVPGPFEKTLEKPTFVEYQAPLPARPRNLYFHRPGTMVVEKNGTPVPFSRLPAPDTWGFTATTLKLRVAAGQPPPAADAIALVWPVANAREAAMNRSTFDGSDAAFVFRAATTGIETRTGVYVPAPGAVSWPITVPAGGVLGFEASVLPPEAAAAVDSDGATLEVEVEAGGETHDVYAAPLTVGTWTRHRVALAPFAGQEVTLRLRSEPGANALFDYAFVAEPTVWVPSDDPRRLLLIFVDTLRPDHLGFHGYERPTSPGLDAWAAGAVVFDHARSVASWTLPATRSALSGRQPEHWSAGPNVSDRLAAEGWATSFWGGNVYLSTNFDMAEGWSVHTCENWPLAGKQVKRVEAWLADHADRDAAALIHLMDTHLPYTEPRAYRGRWAAKKPPTGLKDRAVREPIAAAAAKEPDAVREWVTGRYDQNIAFVDDQLASLLSAVGDRATVVLFSDHGEEFWEHGGFEHGHSLYDEVLRVPFVISDPTLAARRVAAPVSLLDLTPTVLELLGIEPGPGVGGQSLVAAARGEPGAEDALAKRPLAFGRTLYGAERWGVLVGADKWTIHQGREALYDVATDPGEKADRHQGAATSFHEALAEVLERQVPVVWRVAPAESPTVPVGELTLELSHPDGIAAAWLGSDPQSLADMALDQVDANTWRVTFGTGSRSAREIFLKPAGDPAGIAGLSVVLGDVKDAVAAAAPDGDGQVLLELSGAGRTVQVTYAVAPVPAGDALVAIDEESRGALEALGYLSPE